MNNKLVWFLVGLAVVPRFSPRTITPAPTSSLSTLLLMPNSHCSAVEVISRSMSKPSMECAKGSPNHSTQRTIEYGRKFRQGPCGGI